MLRRGEAERHTLPLQMQAIAHHRQALPAPLGHQVHGIGREPIGEPMAVPLHLGCGAASAQVEAKVTRFTAKGERERQSVLPPHPKAGKALPGIG